MSNKYKVVKSEINIVYKDSNVVIICGDSRELIPKIKPSDFWKGEEDDFELCITDPPYGVDWNCDYTRFSGERGAQSKYKKVHADTEPFNPEQILKFKERG